MHNLVSGIKKCFTTLTGPSRVLATIALQICDYNNILFVGLLLLWIMFSAYFFILNLCSLVDQWQMFHYLLIFTDLKVMCLPTCQLAKQMGLFLSCSSLKDWQQAIRFFERAPL